MKLFLVGLISIVTAAASAGAPEITRTPEGDPAVVLVLPDGNNHVSAGVLSFTPGQVRPDALTILRNELDRQAIADQERSRREGVFVSTTRRFPVESISFFIAIGAVTFNSMWIKSHGNPTAMARHLESLRDPIAHLSFYAFMQTQGFYMDFRGSRRGLDAMDATTRRQMMRRFSYQGMAVGSLVSSIVADLGHSFTECTNAWLRGKREDRHLAACNQAWAQWTVRDKFTQYFPQILSMWVAQAATEFVEARGSAAFTRISTTSFMQRILRREFLMRQAYKITSADAVLTFAGGGWALKSIKIVGRVTRFSMFVGIDQILSNYTYRPINNMLRPMLFDFDVMGINSVWRQADVGNWDQGRIQDTRSITRFEKRIENFGKQMQQWRAHLNQDAEADLAGWMDLTKGILHQVDYAYKFYKGFANNMYETLQIGHRIGNGQLQPSAATVISRYPYRTLPFYGVKPGRYQALGGRIEDYYILSPNELAMRQKEHVLNTARAFRGRAEGLREKDAYNRMIAKMISGNDLRMASGLNDMNTSIATYQRQVTSNKAGYTEFSSGYVELIYAMKRELGTPMPVIYPFAGYAQAFTAYEVNQVTAESAKFGKSSITQRYRFNKEADLMMYHLICGEARGRLHRVQFVGVNFTTPQFEPPTILRANRDREDFCNSSRNTNNLYSTQIAGVDMRTYIHRNLNLSATGDFRQGPNGNMDIFERWWLEKARGPLQGQFRQFDEKFQRVFQTAYNNFFDQRSFYKQLVDHLNQSRYLPKSLQASLKFESNLYLQILNRSVMRGNVSPASTDSTLARIWNTVTFSPFNYVEFAKTNSETNYASMYRNTPPEIVRLNTLFNQYYGFIQQRNVNFNQYIAHSKKIDDAINDVLVLAGMKRLATAQDEEDLSRNISAPAATGTENSQRIYEDVPIQNFTYKQRMTRASVQGLRLVEAEIRRFIRMRISLSQSLEVEAAEFAEDFQRSMAPARIGHGHAYGGN